MSKITKPVDVSKLDLAFGGEMAKLLPPYGKIPSEFKSGNHPWSRWQAEWFFGGLKAIPVAKSGIEADKAMRHLAAIQRSWAPKHEHKAAGVAYLASLWFESPSDAKAAA